MKDKDQNLLGILLQKQEELLRKKDSAKELCDMPMTQHYRMMLAQINNEIAELKKKRTIE